MHQTTSFVRFALIAQTAGETIVRGVTGALNLSVAVEFIALTVY